MNAPSTRRSPILVWFATVLVTLALLALAACAGDVEEELTPSTITLQKIGGFEGGVLGAAEITAYDAYWICPTPRSLPRQAASAAFHLARASTAWPCMRDWWR